MKESRLARLVARARRLPRSPGVYRFFAADGTLLYVGKAQSLRDRVSTYFQESRNKAPRTVLMVASVERVEFTVTPSEGDALLLEQEQIKGMTPRYNVLFRDDKSYPYLRLSDHKYARLSLHRGKPSKDCYGPFPNGWAVRESIRVLQNVFRLRTCTDANFKSRTRPCLLHQIGQCSAPCVAHPDALHYQADVTAARGFLAGKDREVVARLNEQMEQASARQEYEEAARLRDSVNALAEIRRVSAVAGGVSEADFIGIYSGNDGTAVRLAAVRGGRLVGEIDYFPANSLGADEEEVLSAFFSHHYNRHPPPRRVVVRSEMGPELLKSLVGEHDVTVITHPRGVERERLDMVIANAEQALATHGDNSMAVKDALAGIGSALEIAPPARIDCFDVSHSMGEEAVASCVTCVDGTMEPRRYLRFRLRATAAGDDYAGMREALARRYRAAADDPEILPDLIVIDGGTGQVGCAVEQLEGMGIRDVPLLGIAKGARRRPGTETLVTGAGEMLDLAPISPAFRLLQRIRDEAHRFALAAHRKRRDKKRRSSVLDAIEGVGPVRRRQLINEFGGLQGLRRASPSDLSRIEGVGPELARRIHRALHS